MRKISVLAAFTAMAVTFAVPVFGQDTGESLYKQNCSLCHGDDGKAQTPAGQAFKAPSFKDPAIVKISDADRTAIVKKGKNSMPAFGEKLTNDQITSVLAYIRTLEK